MNHASRGTATAFLLCLLTLSACSADADSETVTTIEQPDTALQADANAATEEPAPRAPVGPATDLPPNELGEIMVLEYHRLGTPEGEFYRSRENFANDLRLLYEAGYRPITVRQMLAGEIDLPAGTSPVIFTIDDSSTGQFYLLEDGSIDPNTMVGMWDAFQAENPAWAGGATWCILPAADHPSNFFGEKPSREVPREERERRIQQKVDYLVENDHEICNHTLYHARLDRARDDAQVQEWIGRGEDSIQVYLPDNYEVVTLALPLGMWPQNRSLAWQGTYEGRPYSYEGVLEVTGGPNVSPFDTEFDGHSINRVIVAPGVLERHLAAYDRDPGRRYVSDGIPGTIAVPAAARDRVASDRWPDREIRAVEAPNAGEAAGIEESPAAGEG